jgi:protein gp37
VGKDTEIAWTDHSFNPWWGCARVSPGCERCYAETFSKRVGLKVWGQQAERRFFGDKHWAEPLKWNRDAAAAGVRRRVFCASMADVFEDRRDLDEHRHLLWSLIAETPALDWLLLTKRPENHEMVPLAWQTGSRRPLNVWLGVTAENQEYAERRIPLLLDAHWPAVRFVSYEPALGPVDFWAFLRSPVRDQSLAALGCPGMPGVDWVIVGGESGPRARPFDIDWAQSAIEQCRTAGVAVFCKQLGANIRNAGEPWSWNQKPMDRKGGNPEQWPEHLRVREFPAGRTA